jgi:hypothetical protein
MRGSQRLLLVFLSLISAPAMTRAAEAPSSSTPTIDSTDQGSGRPEAFSIGIGAGYTFPTNITAPNTATVRFRFESGLTIEPFVNLSASGALASDSVTESTDSAFTLSVGSLVRIPLVTRGKIDLNVLGGASIGFTNSNPEGPDNTSRAFSASLTWASDSTTGLPGTSF